MPKRLIVNADDFGLTPGVNNAILELHAAGAVSSTTLMARGAAFEHAAAAARQHPTLGIGCHIVLTDGTPVSPPETISSLIGKDGRNFRPVLRNFLLDTFRGRLHPDHIRREAIAQIHTLQQAGIRVTHLDTHKHTHVFPQVLRPLLEAAEATGVYAIRNPFERPWSLRFGYTRPFRLLSVAATRLFEPRLLAHPALQRGQIRTTQGTVGISATGRLDEPLLRRLLAELPDGTWELVCHPGYNDPDLGQVTTRLRETRDVERRALLTVLGRMPLKTGAPETSPHPPPPELIHYGQLQAATDLH